MNNHSELPILSPKELPSFYSAPPPKSPFSYKTPIIILTVVFALFAFGTGGFFLNKQLSQQNQQTVTPPPSIITPTVTIQPTSQPTLQVPTTSVPKPTSTITPREDDIEIVGVTVVPNQNSNSKINPTTAQSFPDMTVGVSGMVYRDENCNGNKESHEVGIGNVTINIFKNPEFSMLATIHTDANGNYTWSKTIKSNESIGIELAPISPEGYKSNPNSGAYAIGLHAGYKTATYILPQVPNENVSSCFQ